MTAGSGSHIGYGHAINCHPPMRGMTGGRSLHETITTSERTNGYQYCDCAKRHGNSHHIDALLIVRSKTNRSPRSVKASIVRTFVESVEAGRAETTRHLQRTGGKQGLA